MSLVKKNSFGFEYRTVQRQRGALGKALKARRAMGLVCTTKKEYMNNLILFMSVERTRARRVSLRLPCLARVVEEATRRRTVSWGRETQSLNCVQKHVHTGWQGAIIIPPPAKSTCPAACRVLSAPTATLYLPDNVYAAPPAPSPGLFLVASIATNASTCAIVKPVLVIFAFSSVISAREAPRAIAVFNRPAICKCSYHAASKNVSASAFRSSNSCLLFFGDVDESSVLV